MLNIGEMGALALHALTRLAERHADGEVRLVSIPELAKGLDASQHTLHKVVRKLVTAGLVESARGPGGGVRLARSPDEIAISDVLEAVEGGLKANGCLFAKRVCPENAVCQFSRITGELENGILSYFTTTTLADLVPAKCL